jgi:hypothetical protein
MFHQEGEMRIVVKLLFVLSLASLFTGCPAQEKVVVPGKLEEKITGLLSGTDPSVSITGLGGFIIRYPI